MFQSHNVTICFRVNYVEDSEHALFFRVGEGVGLALETWVDVVEVGGWEWTLGGEETS